MLLYSHFWDLLLKLVSLSAVVILLIAVHVDTRLSGVGIPTGYAVFMLVAGASVIWILLYRQWLSTVAAWLYANVNLGAHVSLGEARQLARLFQLDVSMKWVPLKEVRQLPRAERRVAVLSALHTLGPRRRAMLF